MKKVLIIAALVFISPDFVYAIGDIGVGFSTGYAYDPNNIEDDIMNYNAVMRKYEKDNANTEYRPINMPYYYVIGASVKYHFNYILFRIGAHYTNALLFPSEGAIQPDGQDKNTIKFETYQASFPLTVAFILPLRDKTYLYFGGGVTAYIIQLNITQSAPGIVAGLPAYEKEKYYTQFGGFTIMAGIEIPMYAHYTITAEWVHQFGRSPQVSDKEDTGQKRVFDVNSNLFIMGVNYYLKI